MSDPGGITIFSSASSFDKRIKGIEALKLAVSRKELSIPSTSNTFAVLGTDGKTREG